MDNLLVDELIQVVKGCTKPPPDQSCFSPYSKGGNSSSNYYYYYVGAAESNLNKRMMGFHKTNWKKAESSKQHQSFRHMMSERLRRDKEKKGYSSLFNLLPPHTKNKNAIVTGAMRRIEELEGYKKQLERRIQESSVATKKKR
ncbi:Transcription factor bHLH92 [Linum grandiflorum]